MHVELVNQVIENIPSIYVLMSSPFLLAIIMKLIDVKEIKIGKELNKFEIYKKFIRFCYNQNDKLKMEDPEGQQLRRKRLKKEAIKIGMQMSKSEVSEIAIERNMEIWDKFIILPIKKVINNRVSF